MKKVVMKLDVQDEKQKQKALKAVSVLYGIDNMGVDMKDQKMMVVGSMDPVDVVAKLRRFFPGAHIVSVGPAKEEKKDGGGDKKDGDKKDGGDKKGGAGGDKKHVVPVYPSYCYPPPPPPRYVVHSTEEAPNSCVIC